MASECRKLIVLIPVYNDWQSISLLLPHLNESLAQAQVSAHVLLVDDASSVSAPADLVPPGLKALSQVDILCLRRNLSHQRAIAVGLCYIQDNLAADAVLVMDGDGEDKPSDVPRLIGEFLSRGKSVVVFAERAKRSEHLAFRFFYHLYRVIHWLLTGRGVRVGNFSILPSRFIANLSVASELWNHYAAAVMKNRLPYVTVPTERGRRLAGASTMNFVSLTVHGLSAISVYGEVVGVRLLTVSSLFAVGAVIAIAAAVALRLFSSLAIPGWATYVVGIAALFLLQAIMLSVNFVLMILNARQNSTVIPLRDYRFFVHEVKSVEATSV